MPAVWAIVVAAGRGERFGGDAAGPAKQFLPLGDARVVDRAVTVAAGSCDAVVLVLAPGTTWDGPGVDAVVEGGATRSESVRRGLDAVPADADVVVVHDAARPLATRGLFTAVVAAVRAGADGAIPGVPVADTVKRVDGAEVRETVPRHDLVAVQTPQAFRAAALRDAHRVRGDGAPPDATDDAALVEGCGGRVVVVDGEPHNLKITTADDLLVAETFVRRQAGADRSQAAGRGGS
jgi:2-C-methyl-D-erythritol 4-phosphate cytidylyltransferase